MPQALHSYVFANAVRLEGLCAHKKNHTKEAALHWHLEC